MGSAGGAGSQLAMLLVLLGILGGAGAWNYQRNVALEEEAEPRPYRAYSDADLEALRSAYQEQVDLHTQRYRAASSREVRVRQGGLLGEQVSEFERVQEISVGKRKVASDFAKNQVQLEAIDAEIARRATEGDAWQVLLRRVTTLP